MIRNKFEKLFFQYSWVIAFILLCSVLYERSMAKREIQFQNLKEQLSLLRAEKEIALNTRKKIEQEINSQSDLAWIELTLIKGLGVTPEDQQKIYFDDSSH